MKTRYTLILIVSVAIATLSFSFKNVMLDSQPSTQKTVTIEVADEPIGGFVIDESY